MATAFPCARSQQKQEQVYIAYCSFFPRKRDVIWHPRFFEAHTLNHRIGIIVNYDTCPQSRSPLGPL